MNPSDGVVVASSSSEAGPRRVQDGSEAGPRRVQDGSEAGPRRVQDGSEPFAFLEAAKLPIH